MTLAKSTIVTPSNIARRFVFSVDRFLPAPPLLGFFACGAVSLVENSVLN